jgi:hypothetical protein
MLVVVYVFAIVGMEIIVMPESAPGTSEAYQEAAGRFDSLWEGMLILMQFMTLDGMAQIYRPLVEGNPWLVFYFLGFFLVGPVALMNIVTAIMVESSLRTANEDTEAKKAWEAMKKKALLPKLKEIFTGLDLNGDDEVDLEELQVAPDNIKEQIMRIIDMEELEEVFSIMDSNGNGSISVDEFIDGIMRSQAEKPSELLVIMKLCRAILDELHRDEDSPRLFRRISGSVDNNVGGNHFLKKRTLRSSMTPSAASPVTPSAASPATTVKESPKRSKSMPIEAHKDKPGGGVSTNSFAVNAKRCSTMPTSCRRADAPSSPTIP